MRITAFLCLILFTSAAWAAPTPEAVRAPRGLAALQAAQQAGRVTPGKAALYRFWALTDPRKLPAEFQDLAVPAPSRPACGTARYVSAQRELAHMDPADRALAEAALPPVDAPEPADRAASDLRTLGKTTRHRLPHYITTDNFSIEWGNLVTAETGGEALDLNANNVPDVAERWAAAFEYSYARMLAAPLGLSASRLDAEKIVVVLGKSLDGNGGNTVDDIDDGSYAVTRGYFPTLPNDSIPYIVVNNRFPNTNVAKVTAAHELFHVFQAFYAPLAWDPTLYPATGDAAYNADTWWMEASSSWIEDEIFDSVDDYLYWVNDWLGTPGNGGPETTLAIDRFDTFWDRAYGAAIFGKYLTEHVRRDAVVSLWKTYMRPGGATPGGYRVLDAMNALAGGVKAGLTVGDLYMGFAAANATRDYEEGASYANVPFSSGLTVAAAVAPEFLGAYYRRATLGGASPFEIDLAGTPSGSAWGLAAVREPADGGPAVVLTSRLALPSVVFAEPTAGDVLHAVPCYLDPTVTGSLYQTGVASPTVTPTPPALDAGRTLTLTPTAGGLEAEWSPASDPDGIGGYVVTCYPDAAPGLVTQRTLAGPVTRVWLGELSAVPYTVEVRAYDTLGSLEAQPLTLSETPLAADVPPVPLPTPAFTPGNLSSGGGGGGGGGCFLNALFPVK